MSSLVHTAIFAATTSTTTAKKSSSSSSTIFLVILVIAAAGYFLFLRPRQQRARAQRTNNNKSLAVGDDVVTIGGILGRVSAVDGESVTVEVAPDTYMSFLPRAVNLRTAVPGAPRSNPVPETADYHDDDGDVARYDDGVDDDGWDDEAAAGHEPAEPTPGAGPAGEAGTGGVNDDGEGDRGGRGEGRRR